MENLVNGLFDFFIAILEIITSPIQSLIENNFPSLDGFVNSIGSFFNIINSSWIPWIKDLTFLPQWTFDLILGYLFFVMACTIAVNVVKLVLKYWEVLV